MQEYTDKEIEEIKAIALMKGQKSEYDKPHTNTSPETRKMVSGLKDSFTEHFKFIGEKIDLLHNNTNEKLVEIKIQTTEHNTRMKKLEQWKAYITGGLAVVMAVLLPTLIWALTKL